MVITITRAVVVMYNDMLGDDRVAIEQAVMNRSPEQTPPCIACKTLPDPLHNFYQTFLGFPTPFCSGTFLLVKLPDIMKRKTLCTELGI